jgi:hypothetical protein
LPQLILETIIQRVAKEEMVMTEVKEVLTLGQEAQVPMPHLVVLQALQVVQVRVETEEVLLLPHHQKSMEHNKLVTAELVETVATLELLETVELVEWELLVETLV